MFQLVQDLRYSVRQLRKSPGFTMTAVITLALGIGATTAIFTLVHAVMLKSLPVTRPEELYRIGQQMNCCNFGGYVQPGEFSVFNYELYQKFRGQTQGFSDLAAFEDDYRPLGVRRMGTSRLAVTTIGQFASGNFFRALGVGAWMGRTLNDSDDRASAAPVAVMSYRAWQNQFGSDPSVVGAVFQVNSKPFTVVGVAAPGFNGVNLTSWGAPDFWIPIAQEPIIDAPASLLSIGNANWLYVLGRVRPGADPKAIESQLKIELRQWQVSHLADMSAQEKEYLPKETLHLEPGGAGVTPLRDEYASTLLLLLATSGCVLLIACANIANLQLARGLKNRQQASVRMALGAGRSRLVRQALVESTMLGLMGGAAGVGVAYAGTALILRLAFGAQGTVPIDAAPSVPVLLFTFGISLATGVGFGVGPAWMNSHADPIEALRGANRTLGGGARWPQEMLVIGQAALSVILLSAAAMLSQSLRNLERQNFGFDPQGRYVASIEPRLAGYKPEQLDLLYRRIEERLRRIPGIKGYAAATYAPMSGGTWFTHVYVNGRPAPRVEDDSEYTLWSDVTPGFFATLGNRILMGRSISEHDTDASPHVAIVNQAFAQKYFKGKYPIGEHFGMWEMSHASEFEVVGVAADMRYQDFMNPAHAIPMIYVPALQHSKYSIPDSVMTEMAAHYLDQIVLWAPGDAGSLEEQVRRALADINPNLVVMSFQSYPEAMHLNFSQQDMIAKLTLLFGGLALLLAAIGLYGVTAYTVEQRTNEIGIRMTLGADRASVLGLVLRSAFGQVAIGLAIGVPAAIAAGKAMTSQLYAVAPYDPGVLALATLLLGVAALIAAVIPARRAASIQPMQALRTE